MRKTSINEKVKISIIGAGNRATAYITAMQKYYNDEFEIVAIFDPNPIRKEYYKTKYNVGKIYDSYEAFLELPRISDVVIIATLDDMHFIPTIAAIEKGYDIILEKPISMNLEETIAIGEAGRKHPEQFIAVCHVLRHSPFFDKLKEIIDSKVVGNVIDIQHNENVGYYHFAHSYVRGSWRNTDISAPFIVAKSCHDLDIILYLLKDKHCKKLSSYGNLTFFTKDKFDPENMAPRCSDCKIEKNCPYSALQIYSSGKMKSVVFDTSTADRLKEELAESQYGRCVFACDNNVCDHQVTAIEFEDGVHATFNLSAFTEKNQRSIKIMCEYGEIRGLESLKEIEVIHFGTNKKTIYTTKTVEGGHGGADEGFVKNFMGAYLYGEKFDSTLEMSIESHIMAYGAEESRLHGGKTIDIKEYHQQIIQQLKKEK